MKVLLIVVGSILAFFVLDQLLLAAERRGWIYWRKKSASPGTTASAMLEVQSMFEPGRAHVVEASRAEATEEDDEGDDIDSRGEHSSAPANLH